MMARVECWTRPGVKRDEGGSMAMHEVHSEVDSTLRELKRRGDGLGAFRVASSGAGLDSLPHACGLLWVQCRRKVFDGKGHGRGGDCREVEHSGVSVVRRFASGVCGLQNGWKCSVYGESSRSCEV
jgi:hypothetical protein